MHQYKITTEYESKRITESHEQWLNRMSENGWDLITVIPFPNHDNSMYYKYIFKSS